MLPMTRLRISASGSAWRGGRADFSARKAVGGSGRLGVGEWVKSVNAARRTWGWACERRGVTKEEGMLSVGLGVVLGPGVVASTGISGGCLI